MDNEFIKRTLSSIILFPLVILVILEGKIIFNLFLILCLLLVLNEWSRMKINKILYYIGFIYLIFSFYTVHEIQKIDNELNIFLLILLICISTDIGGYAFGKLFKGPKLTNISPKKTYSGVFGGYFLSLITVNLLANDVYFIFQNFVVSQEIFFLTICISTISQIGDITISYFKRKANIKDTGNILPGHGGLLDRIDGMIFAFPFFYIIFSSGLIIIK